MYRMMLMQKKNFTDVTVAKQVLTQLTYGELMAKSAKGRFLSLYSIKFTLTCFIDTTMRNRITKAQ